MSDVVAVSKMLQIDRSAPFDPVALIGGKWSIVEQDKRSIVLSEIDINKINLETVSYPDERVVHGQRRFQRLRKVGHIRLDAQVLLALLEDQALIPEHWKLNGRISFDGTRLWDRNRNGYVLVLRRLGGKWCWDFDSLDVDCDAKSPSACLAE
ncbi:MAG: hypothetical protein WAV09_02520 [Minisyncoccia bacterium]